MKRPKNISEFEPHQESTEVKQTMELKQSTSSLFKNKYYTIINSPMDISLSPINDENKDSTQKERERQLIEIRNKLTQQNVQTNDKRVKYKTDNMPKKRSDKTLEFKADSKTPKTTENKDLLIFSSAKKNRQKKRHMSTKTTNKKGNTRKSFSRAIDTVRCFAWKSRSPTKKNQRHTFAHSKLKSSKGSAKKNKDELKLKFGANFRKTAGLLKKPNYKPGKICFGNIKGVFSHRNVANYTVFNKTKYN